MELYLHLGAHRTGSTAFQRTLKRNAGALEQDRIAYWGPERLRAKQYFYLRPRGAFDAGAEQAFAADAAATGAERLVISEENILGSMRLNMLKRHFYADAAQRLLAYGGLMGMQPARIGLGIRDYGAYWTSAYAYLLPAKPLPTFAELKPGLLTIQRGWRDVIADLRGLFPDAEIIVWPLEAVQGHMREVVARFVGRAAQRLASVKKRINTAPGTAAIPLIEAIRADEPELNGAEMRARLAEIDFSQATAPELFTGEERLMLTARYAEDLAALEAGFEGVSLLAPHGGMA